MKIVILGNQTIRNKTALKRPLVKVNNIKSFGTIRNKAALKLFLIDILHYKSFGTIRNNTALKHPI